MQFLKSLFSFLCLETQVIKQEKACSVGKRFDW